MGIKGKNDRMVVLACEDCKERNYTTVKEYKGQIRIEQILPFLQKHTTHKETK